MKSFALRVCLGLATAAILATWVGCASTKMNEDDRWLWEGGTTNAPAR